MNNENEVMEKAPVLTKKDCVKGAIRWSLMAVAELESEVPVRKFYFQF